MSLTGLFSLRCLSGGGNFSARSSAHLRKLVLDAGRGLASTSAAGELWSRRSQWSAAGKVTVYSLVAGRVERRAYASAAHAYIDPNQGRNTHYHYSHQHVEPRQLHPGEHPRTGQRTTNESPPPHTSSAPTWTPQSLMQYPEIMENLSSRNYTPAKFRAAFESANLSSYYLARVDNLRALWDIWSAWDRENQRDHWGWLVDQLGPISDARQAQGIDRDMPPLIHALRGYGFWKVGAPREAFCELERIGHNHTGSHYAALTSLIRAKATLGLLGPDAAFRDIGPGGVKRLLSTALRHVVRGRAHLDGSTLSLFQEITSSITTDTSHADYRPSNAYLLADIIADSGPSVRHYLLNLPPILNHSQKSLTQHLFTGLNRMPEPLEWLDDRSRIGTSSNARWMGAIFLLEKLHSDPSKAFTLFQAIRERDLPVLSQSSIRLLRYLVRTKQLDQAGIVAEHIRSSRVDSSLAHVHLSALLELEVARQDRTEIQNIWESIVRMFTPTLTDKLAYMRGIADLRDLTAVQTQIRSLFGNELDQPLVLDFLLRAAITGNNIELAEQVFGRLKTQDPTVRRYNAMLGLYAANADSDSAVQLFDEMLDGGNLPNVASFTSLIALFANRRDVENARSVFSLMLESNIVPDSAAWTSIINAEVEAGEWAAAGKRWFDIPHEMRNSLNVVSVILKAYVLLAVPTSKILAIFRRIDQPNSYLWALVIQSALDNGDLDLAYRLFDEMDHRAQSVRAAPAPDVYHFSILLHGFMRHDEREEARRIYSEMLSRNIVPSSVTYAMILSAFRNAGDAAAFQQASRFAASIDAESRVLSHAPRGRGTVGENIFGPLINMSADTGRYHDALAYLEDASGSTPTVPLYTRLMDAYRQAGQTDSVMAMWDKTFELALTSTKELASNVVDGFIPSRSRSNILSVPLSVVLDALASAGRHFDIRRIWDTVQAAGFGFDGQNYNHYATALARTGDVDRAFAVVETILIPRWEDIKKRRVAAMREAEFKPSARSSPDSLVSDIGVQSPFRPPNRRHETRWTSSTRDDNGQVDIELLRKWRPTDMGWRPSYQTLSVLEHAYSQLSDARSRAWIALGASDEDADPDVEPDAAQEKGPVTLPSFGDAPIRDVDGSVKKTTPRAVIFRLHRKYAKVVALIMFHRQKRSRGSSNRRRSQ